MLNTTDATSVAGTAYPSGAPEFSTSFWSGLCYLIFSLMFCISLFVHLSFFLLTIVFSVLLRFTDSDYPFGIFKLFLKTFHYFTSYLSHFIYVDGCDIQSNV